MNEEDPVSFMMRDIRGAVKDLEVVESRDLPGPVRLEEIRAWTMGAGGAVVEVVKLEVVVSAME
jgi:hypothetical protein